MAQGTFWPDQAVAAMLRLAEQAAAAGEGIKVALHTGLPGVQLQPEPIPAAGQWVPVAVQAAPAEPELCWTWDGNTVGLGMYAEGVWLVTYAPDPTARGEDVVAWARLKAPPAPELTA